MFSRKKSGLVTVGSFKLSRPFSTTNMERLGSASLSLDATTQPAVPPGAPFSFRGRRDREACGWLTSHNYHVHLVKAIRDPIIDTAHR
jgi:hypothetical protein